MYQQNNPMHDKKSKILLILLDIQATLLCEHRCDLAKVLFETATSAAPDPARRRNIFARFYSVNMVNSDNDFIALVALKYIETD